MEKRKRTNQIAKNNIAKSIAVSSLLLFLDDIDFIRKH